METRFLDFNDRLCIVRKDEDGTFRESHALWNNGRRRVDASSRRRDSYLHQWRTHYAIEGHADGLLHRILRKLGLR